MNQLLIKIKNFKLTKRWEIIKEINCLSFHEIIWRSAKLAKILTIQS
jgi:hypothetical protein